MIDLNKIAARWKSGISDNLSRIDSVLESAMQKDKIFYTVLIVLFVIALAIRIYFSFIIPIIREDALGYLIKAEQILQGDFAPQLGYGIGLSVWESIFIWLLGSGELLKDISIVKALSAVTGTLLIIPLALIGNKLFNRRVVIISVILFTFQPWLIRNAASAYSEPLFTLILLTTFYFLLKSTDHRYYLFFASGVASFAYWTRPNGMLLLLIILIYAILMQKDIPEWKNRYIIYMILIFILVSSPHLYLRWSAYGSPTYYGTNSNLFADNKEQAGSPNYEGQNVIQFLTTHSPLYILKRQFIGLSRVLDAAMANMLVPVTGFAIIGLILTFKRKYSFIHITYAIWIFVFSWVFSLFNQPRYFIPLVPLATILAAFTIDKVSKQTKLRSLTIFIILFYFIALSGIQLIGLSYELQNRGEILSDGMEWAQWISENIEPDQSIAIREGGDLIRLSSSKIKTEKIPLHDNLSATIESLQEQNTNYLVVGEGGPDLPDWERRPALEEVYFGECCPEYLELTYSNRDSDSRWKVQIYRIKIQTE